MEAQELQRIYNLKTTGLQSVLNDIGKITAAFRESSKAAASLSGGKGMFDPSQLSSVNRQLEIMVGIQNEMLTTMKNLKVEVAATNQAVTNTGQTATQTAQGFASMGNAASTLGSNLSSVTPALLNVQTVLNEGRNKTGEYLATQRELINQWQREQGALAAVKTEMAAHVATREMQISQGKDYASVETSLIQRQKQILANITQLEAAFKLLATSMNPAVSREFTLSLRQNNDMMVLNAKSSQEAVQAAIQLGIAKKAVNDRVKEGIAIGSGQRAAEEDKMLQKMLAEHERYQIRLQEIEDRIADKVRVNQLKKTVEEEQMLAKMLAEHEAYMLRLEEMEDRIAQKVLANELKKLEAKQSADLKAIQAMERQKQREDALIDAKIQHAIEKDMLMSQAQIREGERRALAMERQLERERVAREKALPHNRVMAAQTNRVDMLQAQQNMAIAGSYKAMSAELSLLKISLKNYTEAQLKNDATAKQMLATHNRLSDSLKRMDALMGTHVRNVGNYSSALAGLQKYSSAFMMGMGIYSGTMLAMHAATSIRDYMKESVDMYRSVEGIRMAFNRLNDPNLLNDLREATKGTISDLELMKNSVRAANLELPMEKMALAFKFARERARETGLTMEDILNRVVQGIGRNSVRLLEPLGFTYDRLRHEVEKYGNFSEATFSLIEEAVKKVNVEYVITQDRIDVLNAKLANAKVTQGEYLSRYSEGLKAIGLDLFEVITLQKEFNDLLNFKNTKATKEVQRFSKQQKADEEITNTMSSNFYAETLKKYEEAYLKANDQIAKEKIHSEAQLSYLQKRGEILATIARYSKDIVELEASHRRDKPEAYDPAKMTHHAWRDRMKAWNEEKEGIEGVKQMQHANRMELEAYDRAFDRFKVQIEKVKITRQSVPIEQLTRLSLEQLEELKGKVEAEFNILKDRDPKLIAYRKAVEERIKYIKGEEKKGGRGKEPFDDTNERLAAYKKLREAMAKEQTEANEQEMIGHKMLADDERQTMFERLKESYIFNELRRENLKINRDAEVDIVNNSLNMIEQIEEAAANKKAGKPYNKKFFSRGKDGALGTGEMRGEEQALVLTKPALQQQLKVITAEFAKGDEAIGQDINKNTETIITSSLDARFRTISNLTKEGMTKVVEGLTGDLDKIYKRGMSKVREDRKVAQAELKATIKKDELAIAEDKAEIVSTKVALDEAAYRKQSDLAKALQEKLTDLKLKLANDEKQLQDDEHKNDLRRKETWAQIRMAMIDTAKQIADIYMDLLAKQDAYRQEMAQRNLDWNKKIMNATVQSRNEQIIHERAAMLEERRLSKQRMEDERKRAKTKIAIDYAVAVMMAYATVKWPLSMIAAGAATVAHIAAQQALAKAPAYKEGTKNGSHPGGLAWVGDGGESELVRLGNKIYTTPSTTTLVDLPRGAEVTPMSKIASVPGNMGAGLKAPSFTTTTTAGSSSQGGGVDYAPAFAEIHATLQTVTKGLANLQINYDTKKAQKAAVTASYGKRSI